MTEMHREALEEGQKDIIEQCFDSYAYKIDELEEKDLRALRQRKYKLAEMKRNILKDLEDAQADREESMRERGADSHRQFLIFGEAAVFDYENAR